MEATKPVKLEGCQHEADPKTVKYDRRVGRTAKCSKCGVRIMIQQLVRRRPGPPKKHMSKKERRRLRAEERAD